MATGSMANGVPAPPASAPPAAADEAGARAREALRAHRAPAESGRELALVDLAMLSLAGLVAVALDGRFGAGEIAWVVATVALSLVVLDVRGAYRSRLHVQPLDGLGGVAASLTLAAMLMLVGELLVSPDADMTMTALIMLVASAAAVSLGRLGLASWRRHVMRRGEGGLPTLVIGAGAIGQLVTRRLRDRPELGLRPVGFLDRNPRGAQLDPPVLGASWDLEEVVRRHDIRLAIVAFSTAPHDVLLRLIRRCRALGVEVALVPRFFEEITNRLEVEHIGGLALLRSPQPDPRGWPLSAKYAIDRVLATAALILLSPVLLACAVAVRCTSPGPILFRQRRAGMDGREFEMLKFRTMRGSPDADGEADAGWAAQALGESAPEPAEAAPATPAPDRRTPVGPLLRRWGLDELPQLLNIARGDMSFVGPRPERVNYAQTFARHVPRYDDRHRFKAGLTGWAQVNGLRGETSLADRVEWDNHYIENWSLWLDVKIVLLTVPALIRSRT